MSPNFNFIKEQAIALPVEERADLAHELLVSLDVKIDTDVEAAWEKEIRKRVEEVKSGKAKGRMAEDVLADIRAKYL